ncbi:MAG: NAD(P)H-hydrate dehydratase [Ilumatobacteraceae bacterium]
MLPIVTPEEMRAIDTWAPEPPEVLIERAGAAVARAAVRMLGGTYGRTVAIIAGPGNNGADGRVAARLLSERGVRVQLLDPAGVNGVDRSRIDPSRVDLVIDAAYGTGFHGRWNPPEVGEVPVLAVDVPSGVDALTGEAGGSVLAATRTVTFAALKPGLLVPPGSELVGELELADIGLAVDTAQAHLVQQADVAQWWPRRDVDAHKWQGALRVVAGSPTMTGAAVLASRAAMRAGCGMVKLSVPGQLAANAPIEVVQQLLGRTGWAQDALASLDRFRAVVVGPGLGRDDDTTAQTRRFVIGAPLPAVVDGDALFALAWNADGAAALLRRRTAPTLLTPHDGEYKLLTGSSATPDRFVAARRLAADTGCVVLLKGPATVIADPRGKVLVVTAGDSRLATAGTGDVLAGIIGALLAAGLPVLHAAAAGAWVHGRAARRAPALGLVAGDLAEMIPAVIDSLW